MKIIARHKVTREHMIPGAIVELTADEMEVIADLKYDQGEYVQIGREISISKRFLHAMKILDETAKTEKLPGQLRALADTLELSHPAMQQIVKERAEESDTII